MGISVNYETKIKPGIEKMNKPKNLAGVSQFSVFQTRSTILRAQRSFECF